MKGNHAMPDIFELIEKAKQGDAQARERIVQENMGLVWSVAKRFYNRGHDPEDLFQIGSIGLLKAIDKFDMTFGVQFSTYAVPMIMGEIKRFIRDDGIIKVSRGLKELFHKIIAVRDLYVKEEGREPSVNEIADKLGVSMEEVVMAMDAAATPDSLQKESGQDDQRLLQDRIEGDGDFEGDVTTKLALQQALGRFKPRERQIIMLRYFGQKTQVQVAKMIGISQVQVSRIEKRVLEDMRKDLKNI